MKDKTTPTYHYSDLDPDLTQHLENCTCPCNHLGYGTLSRRQNQSTHMEGQRCAKHGTTSAGSSLGRDSGVSSTSSRHLPSELSLSIHKSASTYSEQSQSSNRVSSATQTPNSSRRVFSLPNDDRLSVDDDILTCETSPSYAPEPSIAVKTPKKSPSRCSVGHGVGYGRGNETRHGSALPPATVCSKIDRSTTRIIFSPIDARIQCEAFPCGQSDVHRTNSRKSYATPERRLAHTPDVDRRSFGSVRTPDLDRRSLYSPEMEQRASLLRCTDVDHVSLASDRSVYTPSALNYSVDSLIDKSRVGEFQASAKRTSGAVSQHVDPVTKSNPRTFYYMHSGGQKYDPSQASTNNISPLKYLQAGTATLQNLAQQQRYRRYFTHRDDRSISSAGSYDNDLSYHRRPWCLCLFLCFLLFVLSSALVIPMVINKSYLPENITTQSSLNGHVDTSAKYSALSEDERLAVVKRLLKKSPLIDAHNDLPWNIRKFVHNRLLQLDLGKTLKGLEPWASSPWSQTDIPRMRAGLVGAQFWSAYVPCESQYLDAVQMTLEQIDVIKRLANVYRGDLQLVFTASDIVTVHRTGKIASLIGIEGGHALGNSMAVLRSLYDLGARYVTLTHTCDTPWAESSSIHEGGYDSTPNLKENSVHASDDPGLTKFGLSLIKEMNRLGMMVDLSHTSIATIKAALNVTKAPVIFSHSSAYAVCNSTRNIPDDLLRMLAKNRGVVMVNFYANLVSCNGTSAATLRDVVNHINHIRTIAGIDYVGLGAGYDGINATPSGLNDVSKYPKLLTTLLTEPGWSEKDILKLAGLNILRVFAEVEKIRDGWKLAAIPPGEDIHPPVQLPEGVPRCHYDDQS